jgi:2-dehydro-3-deoxygluconokinase
VKVVTFGEIMLRLSAPGFERLLQTPALAATFGGAEANVAVALAQWGVEARFVTVLPRNPLADAVIAELRKFGVDVNGVVRGPGRLGIYFLETGSNQRASKVVYDRDGSAIALARPGDIDWDGALEGADWFHVTGVTPAISEPAARLVCEAMQAARKRSVTVSCDLNYRRNLWKWGRAASDVMPELVREADLVIANEEDIQAALGIASRADVEAGALEHAEYEALSGRVMEAFSGLKAVAVTLRESRSASRNGWSACIRTRSEFFLSRRYQIDDIVDRVGAGDCFSAGLIYGWRNPGGAAEALEFAVAASCLKHTIPGDFCRISLDEVTSLLKGGGSGRVQR